MVGKLFRKNLIGFIKNLVKNDIQCHPRVESKALRHRGSIQINL